MKALFLESLPYESAFRVGSHHYAERFLSHDWDAMWLSHPLSLLHLLHPVKRDLEVRMRAWRAGGLEYEALRYYNPMTLAPSAARPILRSSVFARASTVLTLPPVRSVLTRCGFSSPDLVWLTNPIYQPVAGRLETRCRVVRVADDTAAFENIPASVRELEQEAIAQADVVFAVAAAVRDRLAATHARVVHLPNGVDAERFGAPFPEPDDLAGIASPRVLYVGAMEYWFDAEVVAECARAMPEASFVLVGPESPNLNMLRVLRNVHVLGPRPYAHVPAYMQHADAGIVPFVRSEMVDSIHPIKVYEYLASGLSVVATRWPEIEAMQAPIALTERDGFTDALRDTLAVGRTEGADERQAYARANSWDARFRTVLEAISPFLEGVLDAPRT